MSVNDADIAAQVLLEAARIFDDRLAGHLSATSELSLRLAEMLGLRDDEKEACRIGGLLHDIGMLGTDSALLVQPSMLVDLEWAEIQIHPESSHSLLMAVPSLRSYAEIVRAHHERLDGSGYPDGLSGYEIPIEARIIAVADAFHTMTIPLPYRNRFSPVSALAELEGNIGTQFEEAPVRALAQLVGYIPRKMRYAMPGFDL